MTDPCPIMKGEQKMKIDRNQIQSDALARCDKAWINAGGLDALNCMGSERAYLSDGVWMHPCGRTYDDNSGRGRYRCNCKICNAIRHAFGCDEY